jgi:2,3-diaminopropionate biosynthesis protein SbnA
MHPESRTASAESGAGTAMRDQAAPSFPRGILSAIGDTPLVELTKIAAELDVRVYAKMERFNPGGSIKDRSAFSMLWAKIQTGELKSGRSVVIESSSGNLGIGLAQICNYFDISFICVVDAKTTQQNLAILKAYRACIEVITADQAADGDYLSARIERVRQLVDSIPGAFWPNQYANPLNSKAHENTMREIDTALAGQIDYLFCPTSSCGTLRGCSDYVHRVGLPTTVIAVDAVGSVLFGDQPPTTRLLPGHGSSRPSALLEADTASHVVHVSDLDCVLACRRLVNLESILAGGSSGATVAALYATRGIIPAGARCVLIFPDGGDRYLNSIYSDDWVAENFGQAHALADE